MMIHWMFILLFCLPFALTAQPAFSEAIIACYPFSGDGADNSGNEYDAFVNGPELTTDRRGFAGRAYQFDGINDHIVAPAEVFTGFYAGDHAISLWVYYETLPENCEWADPSAIPTSSGALILWAFPGFAMAIHWALLSG